MLSFILLILIFCYANGFTPTGKYCGTLSSLITITTTVKTISTIDLDMTIFGSSFKCYNEYVILHHNNTIEFPNSYSRSNCIYKIFNEFGRTDIMFRYDSQRDIINVNLPIGVLKLKHC